MSGDSALSSLGQAGVEIAPSMRAKRVPLDWTPVESHLSAILLEGCSVCAINRRLERRCLFVVSVYAPTECSPPEVKDQFYWKLSRLSRSVRSTDAMIVADDFNAQQGYLTKTERHIGD